VIVVGARGGVRGGKGRNVMGRNGRRMMWVGWVERIGMEERVGEANL